MTHNRINVFKIVVNWSVWKDQVDVKAVYSCLLSHKAGSLDFNETGRLLLYFLHVKYVSVIICS